MRIEQMIVTPVRHQAKRTLPILPWLPRRANDNPVIQSFQFNLFREIAALQQQLRNTNALRITYFYDSGLHSHNVITDGYRSQEASGLHNLKFLNFYPVGRSTRLRVSALILKTSAVRSRSWAMRR